MNFSNPRSLPLHLPRLAVAAAITLLLTLNTAALAAPGAHGPNGEHLDAPTATHAASTLPRLEAKSEAFELVAELRAAELAIVVDRYETNEPVLAAKLEVESGGVKAVAAFRPEQGDYAVTDATFLKSLAAPGAHGPNGEHLDAPGAAVNASGLARLPDGSVNVPKLAQRRMAVRTVLAPESEAAATVEVPGRVIMDPNASGRVQAVHGGRIEPGPKGLPVAGQAVKRGDVLAYVRHHADPFARGAQEAQLADLKSQRQLAEQRVQRLESLEGTVPRKEIEAARTEAASLAERERSIGASLSAREALTAPVSGVIARADLAVGQVVEPRDVLFEVVDPARMLVEATTADATLGARVAGATLQGVPEVTLRLLGASRSLRDGVLPMTFAVTPAKPGAALPIAIGQPVTVVTQSRERIKGVVLPAQAVVRNPSNEPIVWIKSGAERFIPQPVQFRPLDANTVVVTQGLGADNRVVVQGAPLIAQIR